MWAVNEADLSVQTASGYVHVVMRTAVQFEHEKAILRDDFGGIALSIPYRVHCIETLL